MWRIHARMAWLSLKRGKLLWICAAVGLLPALGSALLLSTGAGGEDLYDNVLQLYFHFVVPFVPTLLLASAVSDEIEGRTMTFLFARPAPRGAFVIGRWCTATALSAAIVVAGLAVAFGVASIGSPVGAAHFLRTEAAALFGVAAFGALAQAMGTFFTKHPLVVALGYLLLVEETLGSAPVIANVAALSWHLRNLADLGQPSNFGPTAHLPVVGSAALLLGVTAGALAVAGLRLRSAELR